MMAQEKMKTQTFDELIHGGGGISFKEFIEKNFKPSLHDLILEMVRKPSIAECLATFTKYSSDDNMFEDDVLEYLDEGSCSDCEDLGGEVFSTLLLPHVVLPQVVIPRFCLPELEVPSDEEDSDDYIFTYVKHSSVSRV